MRAATVLVVEDNPMRETAPPRRLTIATRLDPARARVSLEVAEFIERTGAPSLSKPFVLEEVQRLVRQVLSRA